MSPLAPNWECTVTPGLALVNAFISALNGVWRVPAPNTLIVPCSAEPAGELPGELADGDEPGELLDELLQPAASAIIPPVAAAIAARRSLRLISDVRFLSEL
jgi:hypothetical protein